MRTKKMPGAAAHILSALLAFVMMLVLVLGCFGHLAHTVLTDEELHTAIALDERVIDRQMARIEARVQEIAGEHPFQVETVASIVTRESVKDFNREVIAWWMGLMKDNPQVEAPAYDAGEVESAVREDPVFQENTPSTRRRTVARDDIAYEVGRAVDKAVMPVRTDLAAVLLPALLEKADVPVLMDYLAMLPGLCCAAAAVLALLILLLMLRRVSKAGLYVGAGLAGAALCVAGVGVFAYLLGIPALVAEISPLLALQVSLLTRQAALRAGICAGAALLAGVVLIGVHQHDMKHMGKSWRVMNQ